MIEEIFPDKLKHLSYEELNVLSEDIRNFLLHKVSQTGGHLASNLGVVELSIALHKVFNSPTDKIIWDVGHQAYIHKILTGRQNKFSSLRKLDGLSGFPKSAESPHDVFDVGHSSTAISAALGYCSARDLLQEDYSVVAVVGDGSMTGGLVYEAMNNAGRSNTNMLVILNDNQMSITRNVGALSRHLNDIRTAPKYRGAKRDIHKLLGGIPLGKRVDKFIETAKDAVKYMLLPGVLFEELGFNYFGPIDGHNIKTLIDTLSKLRSIKGPVLLHVVTTKGKGYPPAEKSPGKFHFTEAFDIVSGKAKSIAQTVSYADVFGKTLINIADKVENLCAITAAMPDGTGLADFQKKYPKRVYDVGIAESHAVTFAAGMAKAGALPVVAVYSSFLQRAYDQILHDVCLQSLHVVFVIDRAGLVGSDGETHQGIFDISFLSHMPNMTIMAPKNRWELEDMLSYAILKHKGPIALRYPKGVASEILKENRPIVQYGKSETIFEGSKIAIVSVGAMMEEAYKAADILKQKGFNPGLYNARFVKPIDKNLANHLRSYKHVFILEDNVQSGGFGKNLPLQPTYHFAFSDKFIEQGTRAELFRRYGLDGEGVAQQILKILD